MKNYMVPLFLILISMAVFHACNMPNIKPDDKPGCGCSEPKGFFLNLYYKTKDGKNLFTNDWENNNNKGPYDTRNTEVYKVINNNDVAAKEPLDSWVKLKKAYGNTGYSGLALTLPTDDKRVSKILIYLYPSQEVDTISYKGEGPHNFPQTKNIFYNGTCVESLNFNLQGGSDESIGYRLTLIKPEK